MKWLDDLISWLEGLFSGGSISEKSDGAKGAFTTNNGLWDIEPSEQGGVYKIDYDGVFESARDKTGVPFALLKAHAVRESNLYANAFRQEPSGKASYGLMQVLWWKNSGRFSKWGVSDDDIGDGTLLYQADINCEIGARIVADNLSRLSLRDAINAYNTGVAESVRVAPGNYVNDVLKIYSTLVKRTVT